MFRTYKFVILSQKFTPALWTQRRKKRKEWESEATIDQLVGWLVSQLLS